MQRDEFPAKEFFSETQKTESIEIAGAVRPRLCMRLTKRLLQLSLIYSYLEPPPIGDFPWPEAGSTLPTVASPSFSYEPAYSDNHVREGDPKFDDPIPALSTPHELLVGVLPGVCALHDPAFCACQRSRFPFLGDPRDQATGL